MCPVGSCSNDCLLTNCVVIGFCVISISVCLLCNSVVPKMYGYINICLIRNCVVTDMSALYKYLFLLISNYDVVAACVLYKCLLVCNCAF